MRITSLFAALALGLSACGGGGVASDTGYNTSSGAEVENARVIAVMSHADWCPSCKIVEPKVASLRAANPLDGLAFLQIDYTAKDEADFFAQAEKLGVGEAIRTRFGEEIFTGRMVLVDADTQRILGEIDKTMDEAAILAAFLEALKSA